jgi:hypothetical protein
MFSFNKNDHVIQLGVARQIEQQLAGESAKELAISLVESEKYKTPAS